MRMQRIFSKHKKLTEDIMGSKYVWDFLGLGTAFELRMGRGGALWSAVCNGHLKH